MFVDCQNFAGSCGHYFLGNWFVALQCITFALITLLNVHGDVNLWVGVPHEIQVRTLIMHEQL